MKHVTYYFLIMWHDSGNETVREVYAQTSIMRRPISGIVSGYHELPYILVAPDEENVMRTVEINGKINVSPKFILSPETLNETFGEVFDPGTFDKDIEGRLFAFAVAGKKNLKIESEYFRMQRFEESPKDHCDRMYEALMMQENTRTGLIFSPRFQYYPVSIDRFISEILEREFRL
jgi:hypothetical protein